MRYFFRQCGGVVVLSSLLSTGGQGAQESEWKILKADHFVIHYRQDSEFAEKVSRAAEEYYQRIAQDLGYARYGEFWRWEKRAKIYLYSSEEDFVRSTGAPKWAAGKANYKRKEIAGFQGSEGFLKTVLPHELAHLIFRDFVGFENDIPLWLDEGVAQWQEEPKREEVHKAAKELLKQNKLIPLDRLIGMDAKKADESGRVKDFYGESASLVAYLIQEHGAERFRTLCGHLRDGKSLNEALRFTYPSGFRNIDELEKVWRKYLAEGAAEKR